MMGIQFGASLGLRWVGIARVKLIVGLGNPGSEYEYSPHNLGFAVVDRLAERHSVRMARKQARSLCGRFQVGEYEIWLVKPQTFMNSSGVAVKEWLANQGCDPESMIVVADDLDLPWGHIRVRAKGGTAGHHGLESIVKAIGSQQFPRVRVGVSPEQEREDLVRYLLSPVGRSRRQEFETVADRAAEAVEMILTDGVSKAMNAFNRRRTVSETPFGQAQAEAKP